MRRLQELNTDAAIRLIASLRANGLARRRSLARVPLARASRGQRAELTKSQPNFGQFVLVVENARSAFAGLP